MSLVPSILDNDHLSDKLTMIFDDAWSMKCFADADEPGIVHIVLEMIDMRVDVPLEVVDVEKAIKLITDCFTQLGELLQED